MPSFAHDGSISPVLGVLQAAYPVWPGMGSEVVFELWNNKKTGKPHVRVLWSGQPLVTSTPLGTLDMVPLADFVAYLDETIPKDPVALCQTKV
jgi:acid phosphatase